MICNQKLVSQVMFWKGDSKEIELNQIKWPEILHVGNFIEVNVYWETSFLMGHVIILFSMYIFNVIVVRRHVEMLVLMVVVCLIYYN